MTTRISTGTTVQTTSIRVLWVVFEGTGLALALNLTMTAISSAEHEQADHGDDDEQPVMECGDEVHHLRRRFLQRPFPRGGLTAFGKRRAAGRKCRACHR